MYFTTFIFILINSFAFPFHLIIYPKSIYLRNKVTANVTDKLTENFHFSIFSDKSEIYYIKDKFDS